MYDANLDTSESEEYSHYPPGYDETASDSDSDSDPEDSEDSPIQTTSAMTTNSAKPTSSQKKLKPPPSFA